MSKHVRKVLQKKNKSTKKIKLIEIEMTIVMIKMNQSTFIKIQFKIRKIITEQFDNPNKFMISKIFVIRKISLKGRNSVCFLF